MLISSVFAFINGMGTIPYAMSKAAVEQLGRGLRIELADHEVSVLTAYFSLVDTEMIKHGVDEDDVVLELLSTLPKPMLKRVTPAHAAAGALPTASSADPSASSTPDCGGRSPRCADSSARPWTPASRPTAASSTSSPASTHARPPPSAPSTKRS